MKASYKMLRILYCTLTLSLIAVWGQSCMNKTESAVYSDMVIDTVAPVDELKEGGEAEYGEYMRLNAIVRKAAHVIEYALVGFQVMCILFLRKKTKIRDYITCVYIGLTVALVDETIQIFSSRGPLILDLWIDLGGIVVGIGVALLIRLIVLKTKKSGIQEMITIEE